MFQSIFMSCESQNPSGFSWNQEVIYNYSIRVIAFGYPLWGLLVLLIERQWFIQDLYSCRHFQELLKLTSQLSPIGKRSRFDIKVPPGNTTSISCGRIATVLKVLRLGTAVKFSSTSVFHWYKFDAHSTTTEYTQNASMNLVFRVSTKQLQRRQVDNGQSTCTASVSHSVPN